MFHRLPAQAVCCADGEHCCPSGYTCDARTASCAKPHAAAAGPQRRPWFSKERALQRGMPGDVKCDNGSSCASGTTCCKLATGEWGCCPLVKVSQSTLGLRAFSVSLKIPYHDGFLF